MKDHVYALPADLHDMKNRIEAVVISVTPDIRNGKNSTGCVPYDKWPHIEQR